MSRVQTSHGFAIGYEEEGNGALPPIVFLHGVGSDRTVWRRQLQHFGSERRSLAFDYPGYGESDPAPKGTSRDDYALAILSALTVLGLERAHVCGLSLGGVIAIALNHLAPARVLSLTLADTFAVHPEGRAIYDRSVAGSADIAAFAQARADALLAQPAAAEVRGEVIETMSRIDPAAYVTGAEAVWLADQRERAAEIRAPTLVLCGTEDKPTPPALSIELAELIPGARYAAIQGAGHLTNIEQPQRFNALVADFVRGVEAPATA